MKKLLILFLFLIPTFLFAQQVGGAGHANGYNIDAPVTISGVTIFTSQSVKPICYNHNIDGVVSGGTSPYVRPSVNNIDFVLMIEIESQEKGARIKIDSILINIKTDLAGDTIEVMESGHYIVLGNLSWSGNNGEFWKIAIFKNGSIIGAASERYTSNNDTGNASTVPLMAALTVGDKLIFMIYNDTDGDDPTVRSGGITIHKMGTQ